MALLKKIMASVGIGGVQMRVQFDQHDVARVGQPLNGAVYVTGGLAVQQISNIELVFYSNLFELENGTIYERKLEIGRIRLDRQFLIFPGETREFPFSFPIPLSVPITVGQSRTWMTVEMDVARAADPAERYEIEIWPHPIIQTVFDILSEMGLRAVDVVWQNKKASNRIYPMWQKFILQTTHESRLKELRLFYVLSLDQALFYWEIVGQEAKEKERLVQFTVTEDECKYPDRLADFFRRMIEETV